MARRKRLILAEFVVTVWEDHIEWGGIESLLCELLHVKPMGGFLPQLRAARRRLDIRPAPSKNTVAAAQRGDRILPRTRAISTS